MATAKDRVEAYEKKKKEAEINYASTPNAPIWSKLDRYLLEHKVGFDTFADDYARVGEVMGTLQSTWHDSAGLKSAKDDIFSMFDRLNGYKTYMNKYGDLANADAFNNQINNEIAQYQSVIDSWDDFEKYQSSFVNADAFDADIKKRTMAEQYGGKSYDEVQQLLSSLDQNSEEYDFLSHYGVNVGYSDLKDYDAELESADDAYKGELQKARNQYALDNTFDLYKDLMENEDFEENSQYVEGEKNFLGQYKDENYAWINNDEARATIEGRRSNYGAPSLQTQRGYGYLTEDEKAVYRYITNTEGKKAADEFLEAMDVTLSKRQYEDNLETYSTFAEEHPVIASVLSVPHSVFGGMTATASTIADELAGKTPNAYDYWKQSSLLSADVRQKVGEDIAENSDWDIGGMDVGQFLYGTGMSMADSLVGGQLFGSAYAALMGTSAATQTAKDLTEKGEDQGVVTMGSMAAGASEMLFEYIGFDNLFKIKDVDSLTRLLTESLKQAGIEGMGELATEVSNIIFDTVFRGDSSEVNTMYEQLLKSGYSESEAKKKVAGQLAWQVGEAFAGGFVSGGTLGGVQGATHYTSTSQLGKEITKSGKSEEVVQASMRSAAGREYISDLKKRKYTSEDITSGKISDAQKGELYLKSSGVDYAIDRPMAERSEGYDAQKKLAFYENYDSGQDVNEYADAFELAYEYGVTGRSVDDVMKLHGVLSGEQLSNIYKAGTTNSVTMRQQKVSELTAKHADKMGHTAGKINYDAIDFTNKTKEAGKVRWKDLSAHQRSSIRVWSELYSAMGINVSWFVSETSGGKRVGANGYYSASDNTIHVDVYAGIDNAGVSEGDRINAVLSHETTHWMKEKAPELYRQVRETVLSTLAKDPDYVGRKQSNQLTMGEVIANEVKRMEDAHPERKGKISDEDAIDELVARSCEDMLTNSEVAQKWVNELEPKAKKTLLDHIKEMFKNIREFFDDLLKQYKSTSEEAKVIRQNKEVFEQLSKKWDEMLTEAVKVSPAVDAELKEIKDADGETVLYSERQSLSDQIDDALAGKMQKWQQIYFGMTSDILQRAGLKNLPILYTQKHLRDALAPKNQKKHTHGLTKAQLLKIPEQLESPVMIMDSISRSDSVVVVTDMLDGDGCPIIAALIPNGTGMLDLQTVDSNFMTSIYGRENFNQFVSSAVHKGALIYANKNKTHNLYTQLRVQFPQALTNVSFDTIIRQSRNIVNTANESGEKNVQYSDRIKLNTPVEQTKDLVAVHNLTEEKLAKAFALDGFPMPSIAVAKADEISATEIETLNNITDRAKYDYLVSEFENNGWDGRPVCVVGDANTGYTALTGSHRILAAKEAGVDVKAVVLEYRSEFDELLEAYSDEERARIANELHDEGILPDEAHYLITRENDLNYDNYGVPYAEQTRYSDRDTTSTYELLGESERLERENTQLKTDLQKLKDKLKLERTITKGAVLNESHVEDVAKRILYNTKSEYSRQELVADLKEVYSYIVQNENVQWDGIMDRASVVARKILETARGQVIENPYYKDVLSDIRKTRISLSETQLQELKNAYGSHYNRAYFGKFQVTSDGIALDKMWQQWSELYPDVFNADVAEGDQIIELLDVYDMLRETAETVEQFNTDEAVRELAIDIYDRFWNVSTVKTLADKQAAEIKRMKFEHRKAMQEFKTEFRDKAKADKKAQRETTARYYRRMVENREQKIAEAKKAGRDHMAEYRTRLARKSEIEKITKKALDLNKKLVSNTKDSHIPEVMKEPVAMLIGAIDFSSERLLGMRGSELANVPTKKDIKLADALDKVRQMAQAVHDKSAESAKSVNVDENRFIDLPPEFAAKMQELVDKVKEVAKDSVDNQYVLNRMELDDLKSLSKMLSVLKHSASNYDKALSMGRNVRISECAKSTMEEAYSKGENWADEKAGKKIDKFLLYDNSTPYYTFKRFGAGAMKVFGALQDGWGRFAFLVKEIIDYSEATYTEEQVKQWTAEVKEFEVLTPQTKEQREQGAEPTYSTVRMTTAQLMSLYCLAKREQGGKHLFGGGISIGEFKDGKKTGGGAKTYALTDTALSEMISALTDEQKAVADKLQEFMNTRCAEWGNEVSMARFGIEMLGEKNYFPIKSDSNNIPGETSREEGESIFRLLNMSFTKAIDPKANNTIVVNDIFDVFASHTTDMAKYNTLALPVLDTFKWLNYSEKTMVGDTQHQQDGVKKALTQAYGKEAVLYINQFLRDLNSSQDGGRTTADDWYKKAIQNYKIASIAGNLRVALLQPTAYMRAMCVIDGKYLTKALSSVGDVRRCIDDAESYCGIAQWKALGFYDTSIARGLQDRIKHNDSIRDKLVETSLKPAEWGDKVTWGMLWRACELEVMDKQNLSPDSAEFKAAVADRIQEVIYQTQVVDSTMTRSQMMRSKKESAQLYTAFMSEPTVSYNMLKDLYIEWEDGKRQGIHKNGLGKRIARTTTAYVMTAACSAVIEAVFDTMRYYDDEEETAEQLWKKLKVNFLSDLSVLNKIPILKDLISGLQGDSATRMDEAFITSVYSAVKKTGKFFDGNTSVYQTAYAWLKALSQMYGLPFGNMTRDVVAFWNITIGASYPSMKIK